MAKSKKVTVTDVLVVELADKAGIAPQHLVNHPNLLPKGVKVEDLTPDIMARAVLLDRKQVRELKDKAAEINRLNGHVPEVVVVPVAPTKGKKQKKEKSSKGRAQVKIFGFAATAVLRWMGKSGGWTVDDAAQACLTFGAKLSDTTVRIQLKAGEKGERGEPATITKAQAKQLRQASK